MYLPTLGLLTAGAVVLATAATDAVVVRFNSAIIGRGRVSAANWSAFWCVLSSSTVISYTNYWVYVVFAAVGPWIGAFESLTFLHPSSHSPRH